MKVIVDPLTGLPVVQNVKIETYGRGGGVPGGVGGGGGGSVSDWGDIGGTLSDQTDLQAALDDKQDILSEGAFVDGDKTKLDGIEALADVTDATNVAAAGAVMTTGNQSIAGVKTLSDDLVLSGAMADILHTDELDIFPKNQTTYGMRVDVVSNVPTISALGAATLAINDGLSVAGHTSPTADSTYTLGTSSAYWSNTYTDRLYLNSGAYIDGGTSGAINAFGTVTIQHPSSSTFLYISAPSGQNRASIQLTGKNASNDGDFLTMSMRTDFADAVCFVYDVSAAAYHNFFRFDYLNDILETPHNRPFADSTWDLGGTSRYWRNTYTDRLYLNSTAYIDGASAGTAALTGSLTVSGTTTAADDIEITNTTKGVILKDSGGGRWRITVATDGSLTTAVV